MRPVLPGFRSRSGARQGSGFAPASGIGNKLPHMTDAATEIPRLNDAQVRDLLNHSLNLLNRNELQAAEAALQQVLAELAMEADACNLMGVLRRIQGRPDEAEEF